MQFKRLEKISTISRLHGIHFLNLEMDQFSFRRIMNVLFFLKKLEDYSSSLNEEGHKTVEDNAFFDLEGSFLSNHYYIRSIRGEIEDVEKEKEKKEKKEWNYRIENYDRDRTKMFSKNKRKKIKWLRFIRMRKKFFPSDDIYDDPKTIDFSEDIPSEYDAIFFNSYKRRPYYQYVFNRKQKKSLDIRSPLDDYVIDYHKNRYLNTLPFPFHEAKDFTSNYNFLNLLYSKNLIFYHLAFILYYSYFKRPFNPYLGGRFLNYPHLNKVSNYYKYGFFWKQFLLNVIHRLGSHLWRGEYWTNTFNLNEEIDYDFYEIEQRNFFDVLSYVSNKFEILNDYFFIFFDYLFLKNIIKKILFIYFLIFDFWSYYLFLNKLVFGDKFFNKVGSVNLQIKYIYLNYFFFNLFIKIYKLLSFILYKFIFFIYLLFDFIFFKLKFFKFKENNKKFILLFYITYIYFILFDYIYICIKKFFKVLLIIALIFFAFSIFGANDVLDILFQYCLYLFYYFYNLFLILKYFIFYFFGLGDIFIYKSLYEYNLTGSDSNSNLYFYSLNIYLKLFFIIIVWLITLPLVWLFHLPKFFIAFFLFIIRNLYTGFITTEYSLHYYYYIYEPILNFKIYSTYIFLPLAKFFIYLYFIPYYIINKFFIYDSLESLFFFNYLYFKILNLLDIIYVYIYDSSIQSTYLIFGFVILYLSFREIFYFFIFLLFYYLKSGFMNFFLFFFNSIFIVFKYFFSFIGKFFFLLFDLISFFFYKIGSIYDLKLLLEFFYFLFFNIINIFVFIIGFVFDLILSSLGVCVENIYVDIVTVVPNFLKLILLFVTYYSFYSFRSPNFDPSWDVNYYDFVFDLYFFIIYIFIIYIFFVIFKLKNYFLYSETESKCQVDPELSWDYLLKDDIFWKSLPLKFRKFKYMSLNEIIVNYPQLFTEFLGLIDDEDNPYIDDEVNFPLNSDLDVSVWNKYNDFPPIFYTYWDFEFDDVYFPNPLLRYEFGDARNEKAFGWGEDTDNSMIHDRAGYIEDLVYYLVYNKNYSLKSLINYKDYNYNEILFDRASFYTYSFSNNIWFRQIYDYFINWDELNPYFSYIDDSYGLDDEIDYDDEDDGPDFDDYFDTEEEDFIEYEEMLFSSIDEFFDENIEDYIYFKLLNFSDLYFKKRFLYRSIYDNFNLNNRLDFILNNEKLLIKSSVSSNLFKNEAFYKDFYMEDYFNWSESLYLMTSDAFDNAVKNKLLGNPFLLKNDRFLNFYFSTLSKIYSRDIFFLVDYVDNPKGSLFTNFLIFWILFYAPGFAILSYRSDLLERYNKTTANFLFNSSPDWHTQSLGQFDDVGFIGSAYEKNYLYHFSVVLDTWDLTLFLKNFYFFEKEDLVFDKEDGFLFMYSPDVFGLNPDDVYCKVIAKQVGNWIIPVTFDPNTGLSYYGGRSLKLLYEPYESANTYINSGIINDWEADILIDKLNYLDQESVYVDDPVYNDAYEVPQQMLFLTRHLESKIKKQKSYWEYWKSKKKARFISSDYDAAVEVDRIKIEEYETDPGYVNVHNKYFYRDRPNFRHKNLIPDDVLERRIYFFRPDVDAVKNYSAIENEFYALEYQDIVEDKDPFLELIHEVDYKLGCSDVGYGFLRDKTHIEDEFFHVFWRFYGNLSWDYYSRKAFLNYADSKFFITEGKLFPLWPDIRPLYGEIYKILKEKKISFNEYFRKKTKWHITASSHIKELESEDDEVFIPTYMPRPWVLKRSKSLMSSYMSSYSVGVSEGSHVTAMTHFLIKFFGFYPTRYFSQHLSYKFNLTIHCLNTMWDDLFKSKLEKKITRLKFCKLPYVVPYNYRKSVSKGFLYPEFIIYRNDAGVKLLLLENSHLNFDVNFMDPEDMYTEEFYEKDAYDEMYSFYHEFVSDLGDMDLKAGLEVDEFNWEGSFSSIESDLDILSIDPNFRANFFDTVQSVDENLVEDHTLLFWYDFFWSDWIFDTVIFEIFILNFLRFLFTSGLVEYFLNFLYELGIFKYGADIFPFSEYWSTTKYFREEVVTSSAQFFTLGIKWIFWDIFVYFLEYFFYFPYKILGFIVDFLFFPLLFFIGFFFNFTRFTSFLFNYFMGLIFFLKTKIYYKYLDKYFESIKQFSVGNDTLIAKYFKFPILVNRAKSLINSAYDVMTPYMDYISAIETHVASDDYWGHPDYFNGIPIPFRLAYLSVSKYIFHESNSLPYLYGRDTWIKRNKLEILFGNDTVRFEDLSWFRVKFSRAIFSFRFYYHKILDYISYLYFGRVHSLHYWMINFKPNLYRFYRFFDLNFMDFDRLTTMCLLIPLNILNFIYNVILWFVNKIYKGIDFSYFIMLFSVNMFLFESFFFIFFYLNGFIFMLYFIFYDFFYYLFYFLKIFYFLDLYLYVFDFFYFFIVFFFDFFFLFLLLFNLFSNIYLEFFFFFSFYDFFYFFYFYFFICIYLFIFLFYIFIYFISLLVFDVYFFFFIIFAIFINFLKFIVFIFLCFFDYLVGFNYINELILFFFDFFLFYLDFFLFYLDVSFLIFFVSNYIFIFILFKFLFTCLSYFFSFFLYYLVNNFVLFSFLCFYISFLFLFLLAFFIIFSYFFNKLFN